MEVNPLFFFLLLFVVGGGGFEWQLNYSLVAWNRHVTDAIHGMKSS